MFYVFPQHHHLPRTSLTMFITTNIRVWRSHSSIVHLCIILYLHLTFINIKTILVSSTTEPFTSFTGRPKTTNNPTSHGNNNGNHLDRPYSKFQFSLFIVCVHRLLFIDDIRTLIM